jgi:hypothetical protein
MYIEAECYAPHWSGAAGLVLLLKKCHDDWSRGITRSSAVRTVSTVGGILNNAWVRGTGVGVIVGLLVAHFAS